MILKTVAALAVSSLVLATSVLACSTSPDASTEDLGRLSVAVMKRPPVTKAPPPPGSGGGSGTTSPCGDNPRQCLGAVGLSCNGVVVGPQGIFAGCNGNDCVVSAGSIDHDDCCMRIPNGHFCGVGNALSNTGCNAEWDKAIHRLAHGLQWHRTVNRCEISSAVVMSEYCAPDDTILASADAAKCCSGRTRAYDAQADRLHHDLQGVTVDGSYTPIVCDHAPAVTSSCTTDAQCRAGTSCFHGHCLAQ